MLKRIVILPALVLLLAGAPVMADQFSANAHGGGVDLFASIETGNGTVSYGIVTGGIGPITGANILQGTAVFVNLGASSTTGSAADTVSTSANLGLINSNPSNFFLQVTGQSGSVVAQLVKTAGGGGGGPSTCTDGAETLCLNNGRFKVEITYDTGTQAGNGQAQKMTSDTGYFWFFNQDNVEMVVKVLDACGGGINRYWVFAGGLTDVDIQMTVTDTDNGQVKRYNNPAHTPFQPIQDTDAFATCP